MTKAHEKYMHVQNAIIDLNDARNVLIALQNAERGHLKNAAFKYALIAYSRPYTASHGPGGYLTLDKKHIPTKNKEMHEKILHSRHKIHAHTDRDIKEAKLHVSQIGDHKVAIPISNKINDLELMDKTVEIISLVEETLDSLIEEEEHLKQAL